MSQTENQVLIGSYTGQKEGQSVFLYDPKQQTAKAILSSINPSYICTHGGYIYIISEIEEGEIITLDQKHQLISRVSTLGSLPCHISLNSNGSYIAVCNYQGGSVAIFETENHKPTKVRCFIKHEGSSTHSERQTGPHPHCSVFSPNDQILFVTDLGTDVVYYYSISKEGIKAEKEKSIKMPGSGPRTVCLASNKDNNKDKRLFVSCELDNTVRMLSYEKDVLELVVAYRISNNPENFPSEVAHWKNQVYVALRGDNMILVFDDNKEKLVQKMAFKVGQYPRHFTITEQGLMYVCCEKENKVYRYLFKEGKILQIGELNIKRPAVATVLTSKDASKK